MRADGLPAGADECKEKRKEKKKLTYRLGRVDVGRTAGWRVRALACRGVVVSVACGRRLV